MFVFKHLRNLLVLLLFVFACQKDNSTPKALNQNSRSFSIKLLEGDRNSQKGIADIWESQHKKVCHPSQDVTIATNTNDYNQPDFQECMHAKASAFQTGNGMLTLKPAKQVQN